MCSREDECRALLFWRRCVPSPIPLSWPGEGRDLPGPGGSFPVASPPKTSLACHQWQHLPAPTEPLTAHSPPSSLTRCPQTSALPSLLHPRGGPHFTPPESFLMVLGVGGCSLRPTLLSWPCPTPVSRPPLGLSLGGRELRHGISPHRKSPRLVLGLADPGGVSGLAAAAAAQGACEICTTWGPALAS